MQGGQRGHLSQSIGFAYLTKMRNNTYIISLFLGECNPHNFVVDSLLWWDGSQLMARRLDLEHKRHLHVCPKGSTLKQQVYALLTLPYGHGVTASQKKKKKKKKTGFPLITNIHFLSYTLGSDQKCTRAEYHGRLKQNRISFAGSLKNIYWYVSLPPAPSSELIC